MIHIHKYFIQVLRTITVPPVLLHENSSKNESKVHKTILSPQSSFTILITSNQNNNVPRNALYSEIYLMRIISETLLYTP